MGLLGSAVEEFSGFARGARSNFSALRNIGTSNLMRYARMGNAPLWKFSERTGFRSAGRLAASQLDGFSGYMTNGSSRRLAMRWGMLGAAGIGTAGLTSGAFGLVKWGARNTVNSDNRTMRMASRMTAGVGIGVGGARLIEP
jgi:hypothetical protein